MAMMEPSMNLSGGGAASASTRQTLSNTDSPSTTVSAFVQTCTNIKREKETKDNTQHHAVTPTVHDGSGIVLDEKFEKLNEIQENLFNHL